METANLEQFYQDILKDPALQERLKTVTDRDSMVALIVQIGKEKGYNFSPEEIKGYLDELDASNSQRWFRQELLEAVAGEQRPFYMDNKCGDNRRRD
ncbi:Nif11-like leader peptide family natural product precursor [Phormidesmis sp. 146-12]